MIVLAQRVAMNQQPQFLMDSIETKIMIRAGDTDSILNRLPKASMSGVSEIPSIRVNIGTPRHE